MTVVTDRSEVCDDDWAFQFTEGGLQELVEAGLRPAADSLEFRKHVSLFATGVAVISSESAAGEVHGVTVNSFGSISLDPPTVLVSLRRGRSHDIISETGRYGASILSEAQRAHSVHFAGNKDGTDQPGFRTRDRVPTLEDCLAWFECEVTQTIEIHDHVLFVGRVTACGSVGGDPLLFFGSAYARRALEQSP